MRQRRLASDKKRKEKKKNEETEEQKKRRLEEKKIREAKRRSEESESMKNKRLQTEAVRISNRRENEIRTYQIQRFPQMKGIAKNSDFRNFLSNINMNKGKMTKKCPHCNAMFFEEESMTKCCSKIKTHFRLPPYARIEPYLEELLTGPNEENENFRHNVRTYNSRFSFISLGKIDRDRRFNNDNVYNYAFSIRGTLYHTIPPIWPHDPDHPEAFQIYFHQNDKQNDIRMSRGINDHVQREVMGRLTELMEQKNPLVQQFKTARQRIPLNTEENYRIKLIAMPGQGSLPTAQEVSVLMPQEMTSVRDIVVELNGGQIQHFNQNHRLYIPMAYPLIFLEGEEGWTPDRIPGREELSPTQYFRYRLHIREDDMKIFYFGRLFQQFCVDSWLIAEQAKLMWFRNHQEQLRTELYQGLMDAIEEDVDLNSIGRRFILPSSHTNGPRYMQEKFHDAMAIVSQLGKPHLFLTYTFNARCKEVIENLLPGQTPFDRPDLVTRLFDLKKKDLKKMILEEHIFGKVKAYVDVIEFQKRGIPHMHMLIILEDEDIPRTPEDIDKLISAEIPNPITHPEAYQTVTKLMIHGPCDPSAERPKQCVVNVNAKKKCLKGFPKICSQETSINQDGYPVYRRRNLTTVFKNGRTIDDRWVVPYNPFLASVFDSHVNLEVCWNVHPIKYIYKYLYKGHDNASFDILDKNDEIKIHQESRYVSAIEATYRLFEKELNTNKPAVTRLQIHEENHQNVVFNAQGNTAIRSTETSLTSWMKYNREHSEDDPECRNLTYQEFTNKYTFNKSTKKWTKRKNNQTFPTISRIYAVNPRQKEKYFLRLLLFHIPGATSFEHLRTVNNTVCQTYQEAAKEMGLIQEDEEWRRCLREASSVKMPRQFRQLFVVILLFCSPQQPADLWNEFLQDFIEDFTRIYRTEEQCVQKALQEIDSLLSIHSKQLNDFQCLPQLDPNVEFPEDREIEHGLESRIIRDELFLSEERRRFEEIANVLRSQMNIEQEEICQQIIKSFEDTQNIEPKYFFIDGPGGTGKTFIYNYLLKYFRSKNIITLATASSGIAANLLDNGRTAHSRFGIPLIISPDSTSTISKQSDHAMLLRRAQVIIWDEAPMMKKTAIECVDRLLRDIMDKNGELFGGKIMIFGGDWRQILPVVIRGSPREIIDNCLKKSYIWHSLQIFKLTENIRIRNDPQANSFSRMLLNIGEGTFNDKVKIGEIEKIKLPIEVCQPLDSFDTFIDEIIRNGTLEEWTILSPKNEFVQDINRKIMNKLPGPSYTFYSSDSVQEEEFSHVFPLEFLNSLKPGGLPPHKLCIKKNSRVILLRNLNPSLGLCNGTQLRINDYKNNLIIATVTSGSHAGDQVFIPRIPMTTADSGLPFTLLRRQYPIQQSYSITINKSQGQTLSNVAIYLKNDCFTHGQLYVAMSRVKAKNSLKIFLKPDRNKYFTKNIVFEEVIEEFSK